ncbi:MAG: SDR family NAD(P)-dependent oxidoreductase [Cyclonatronaceae bacterium]
MVSTPGVAQAQFTFEHQVILVTGGGSGLGLATAKAFAQSGAQVIITGRNGDKLKRAVGEIGNAASFFIHDVARPRTTPALVEQIEAEFGPIQVLVNNAGINMKVDPLEVSDADFDAIIQTNLNGLFALSREVFRRMKPRGTGVIINITSMAALYGIPNVSAYTASKAAVLGLTRSMAVDFTPHGIRVNAIAPGFIDSPMLRKAFDSNPGRKRRVLERTPANTLGRPEDIAAAALFLASDAARFITGINMPVDGGNSIGF